MVRNIQTPRNMGSELFVCYKAGQHETPPTQQESLIKTVPPYTFGELCHFENAFTYIISWDLWDNLIFPVNLSTW